MAKRGWRAVARVRYQWDNGVHGSRACWTFDEAETFAAELRDRTEHAGRTIAVEVERIEPTS